MSKCTSGGGTLRRTCVLLLAVACTAMHAPGSQQLLSATRRNEENLLAAKKPLDKPPRLLQPLFGAVGLATGAAWTTVVLTTIRSNQPLGAMMPSSTHGVFARTSVLSALPLIASCYSTLATASADSWERLGSPTCRRINLALVAAGLGSLLWVGFAPLITQIPGTAPLVSHQSYSGLQRAALMGAYGSTAALSAAVWARSLPEEARRKPLSWPGRVADGVAQSLVTLGPARADDPVIVKYSLLSVSFLAFTATALGTFPLAVVPSWTGRRCSRAFAAWTLLAAASSFNLKEAAESGKLRADEACRTVSKGLKGLGAVYLAAKVGAVGFDPSFPAHYGIVKQVPAAQLAAALLFGLTLRPDE